MESTPSPRARVTISMGAQALGTLSLFLCSRGPQEHLHARTCTGSHTPLVQSQALEGLRGRDRGPGCSPRHPKFQCGAAQLRRGPVEERSH